MQATTETTEQKLVPARFIIEGLGIFDGFDTGKEWNGFAVPAFTHAQGMDIVAAQNRLVGCVASYCTESDEFRFVVPGAFEYDEYTDSFPAVEIDGAKYYEIGANDWIWSKVQASDIIDEDDAPEWMHGDVHRCGTEPTNGDRANWARAALLAFGEAAPGDSLDEEPETVVADLLGDMMHFCRRAGVDFDECLRRGTGYHRDESAEARSAF
jgi:hypothetical protein